MDDKKRVYGAPTLVAQGKLTAITGTVLWKCTPGTDDLLGPTSPGADSPLYTDPIEGRVCIDP